MEDLTGLDLRGNDPRRFDAMIARAKADWPGFDTIADISGWIAQVEAGLASSGRWEGIDSDDFEIFLFLLRSARKYDGFDQDEEVELS